MPLPFGEDDGNKDGGWDPGVRERKRERSERAARAGWAVKAGS